MLKKILNRLRLGGIAGVAADSREREAPGEGEDLPRYPPPHMGLPVASVARVLQTQSALVRAIHQTLGLERGQFESLILPVLERYAAFVHLLPATERDHHCGAGGLLRHGLEVAYWAARASEGVVFVAEGTPLERKKLEPRWHVAVCLAGLLHEIGRPISELTVGDARGTMQWDPYSEPLIEWAQRHRLKRYFLFWRPPRHGLHEYFAGLAAGRVLTPQLSRWLTEPEPGIMKALMQAIMDTAAPTPRDPEHPVAQLVKAADEHSRGKDLETRHHHPDDDVSVPMERHLFEAMRALLASGTWTINQRGARVWATPHGLFVVWKPAVAEILQRLKRDRTPGLSRDPSTLAELLIARGLAIPYRCKDAASHPYWPVAPELLTCTDGESVTLDMLRIADTHLLFESEPPSVVAARVGDGNEPGPLAPQEPVRPPSSPAVPVIGVAPVVTMRPSVPHGASTSALSEPMHPKVTTPPTESAAPRSTGPSVSVNVPEDALAKHGEAGRLLLAMARDVAANTRRWGETLTRIGDCVIVRYPDGVSSYGDPVQVLNALIEAGWLDLDPTAPFKKVRELNGIRGLVLASEPARHVLALATITPSAELPLAPPTDAVRNIEIL